MKYAINTGGRKIRVEDKNLPSLVEKGFVEITENEYLRSQEYISKLDSKPKEYQQKSTFKKERSSFRTWIV